MTMVLEDLPFQFIREITDDFSKERILGEGTFGVVYKGVTKNGLDVALKKMKPYADKQFRNELHSLVKLKHQNIVKVLGYCYETKTKPFIIPDGSTFFVEETHTVLCFEYLHNGNLRKHLSDESREVKLDWHMRFKIIKGICEGLKYMHKDLEEPIYHFDLKPDKILLDKDMVPKIAGFSLSRIIGQDIIKTTDDPYGTVGYQPPEYINRGEISGKFDIFSLGVVIIMILSGHMGYPKYFGSMSSDEFIDQVRKNWRKKLQEACSSSDSLLEAYCRQVETCIQIALNCLDEDSQKRPDIVKIIEKLNKIEVGVRKLPEKGSGISFSEMTVQNNNIEMRNESKDITVQDQNTDLLSSPGCTKVELIDAREISTDVIEELIVGREEEKGEIISLLESSSNKISILPIHGIGGIGKTTFSRLIYNDPKFKCYSKAWVHVSHRFDLNKIRESIISQLSEQDQANERHVVHSSLTKLLPGKSIMIVLDDLWEDNQFLLTELKEMLYHDDSKIIVLVTTRSECIAERICTNLQPYKILPLTNDMCWDILKQRSGFGARDDKEKLRGIGQEIAQKCGGVALAAQYLGFTLRGKNFDQWLKVKDNDIWKEHISTDISLPNHVLASLMLSYSYMDHCLKACFTYCAIFPKGHRIVKNDLIYQWISLGFIKPTELLSAMDLCKKYIMQLQGLSFLQELPKTSEAYSGKTTIFTMHDLVHDLAISLLGNQILDQSKQGNTRGSNCQYALLADCSKPLESCLNSQARLIALRFLDCSSTKLRDAAFAPATSLRVLDLSECSIQKLPDSIGELKQLRYLKTPGVRDQMFPECITKLSHLIYLNLHGSAIKGIPESIGEMKDLMHLDLSGCGRIRRLPDSFMSLEKLVHLDFSNCSLVLRESESLWSLSRLEHLSLSECIINGDLAKALCGLTELQYLDLSQVFWSGNLCRGLQQVLVRFTKLRYLDIRGFLDRSGVVGAKTETVFIEAISSLSSLEYLNLGSNFNLNSIPESIGNLSKLHTLDLSHCIQLERLPASIYRIRSLKILHVAGCLNLDKSTLPQYKHGAMLLPNFVVHAGDGESSSNLFLLEYESPTILEISRLENVKSAEEAQRIKLVKKQSLEELQLVWTRHAESFVEDREVLEQLMPPDTLEKFSLEGYSSLSFPFWMMNVATYLPQVVQVTLRELTTCNKLPPLGQLPNLVVLRIEKMYRIRRIGGDLYGGLRAFPRLEHFELSEMKCLEELTMPYPSPSGEGFLDQLVFANLKKLVIRSCKGIKVPPKSIQQLTRLQRLEIYDCPELVQWCKSEENKMKLAHIKEIILNFARSCVISIQESDREVETRLEVTPVSSSLGAMGPLLRKVDLLLAPKYPLRRSVKHAIQLLKEDLEDINDALVEQSTVDSPNTMAKYWMHEVRELSYDVDAAIDTLMLAHITADGKVRVRPVHVHGHRVGRLKIKGLPNTLKPLTRIARITELRTLLCEASERHQRYELDVCISNPSFLFSGHSNRIPVPREVAGKLFIKKVAGKLVGVDAPKNELTTWLTARAEQLKVLCIVGPAGVGKTALAKELYRELGSQFQCRAFVRVSRTPHMSRLLVGILAQIQRTKQNSDTCSVPNTINEIRKHLQDKRYFIVIDGLWEAQLWDIIKSAFPKGHNCSRIMITCEVKDVATKFCRYHSIDVFELEPLDSQDSQKLFFDTMTGSNVQCHDQLKEVSCRILRECAGLPLATVAIAGLLASQPDNSDLWHHLLQYFFSHLADLSLDEFLKGTVNLCYNILPQDLKTCLLYLTMYPEGCTIRKVDLLKQWIAEGFITATTEGKEGVAENYFAALVNRGMIQPEQIMHNGEVLSCTVHHIVFDLILDKSREENFTTAVDYSQTVTQFFMKVYRLSLHFSCAQYATKLEGIRHSQIRSLSFFGLLRCMPSVAQLRLLRVLILEFWDDYDECISLNLSRISGLVLLRYLKVSSHLLVELPSKIQELKFLETLEIDAKVWAVPDDIVHLPGLLHLSIKKEAKLPEGIGRVTSLQTLQYFDLGNNSEDNVWSLCELINLRDLHITCSTELSDAHLKRKFVVLASSLPKLTNLRSLTVAPGAISMTMFVDYSSAMLSTPMFLQRLELLPPICIFSRLPEWVGKLQKLRILKIVVRVLLSSDIDVLTGLPGLTALSLYIRQPNRQCIVFSSGALPVLKYFKYTCGSLFLAFQEEALPNLERLKLRFNVHKNEMYYHMISGIEHLLNLKEMTVKIGAADSAEESDKKAAESAIKSAIRKHPRFPIYMNVRRIDWVEEE